MSRFQDPIVRDPRALRMPRRLREGHGRRPLWSEQAQRGRSVKWHRGKPGVRWRGVIREGLQGNLITQDMDECTWGMTLHSSERAPYDKEVMTWAASTRISSCDPAASSNCSGAFKHFTRLNQEDNNIRVTYRNRGEVTHVATKSSSAANTDFADGFPMTLFLTLLRVETVTVCTVIVVNERG